MAPAAFAAGAASSAASAFAAAASGRGAAGLAMNDATAAWVRNSRRVDMACLQGYPSVIRAGSAAAGVPGDGHESGASRGTIQTHPTRPAMLISAAVTKAVAKWPVA